MRKIPFTSLLSKELFYGAAGAAVIGLAMGAYLQPPAAAKTNPDPYAGVTINLPADPTVPTGVSTLSWGMSQAPSAPAQPIAWQSVAAAQGFRAEAEPARPTPAVLTRHERDDYDQPREISDDRQDDRQSWSRQNWPSERGDVVGRDDRPAFADDGPRQGWRYGPYEPPPPRYWRRDPSPDYGPPDDGPPSRDDDD